MKFEAITRVKEGYARRADKLALNARSINDQMQTPVIADARTFGIARIAAYGVQAAANALDGFGETQLLGRDAGIVTVARDGNGLVSLLARLDGDNTENFFGLCQESGFRGIRVRGVRQEAGVMTPHDLGAVGSVLEAHIGQLAAALRPGEKIDLQYGEPAFV